MTDSNNKIFAWQIMISVVVGIVWAVLWGLGDEEGDFFFDFPLGVLEGFIGGLVVLVVLAIVVGLIWALVRTLTDKPEGGFGSAMSSNLDGLSRSSAVDGYYSVVDGWTKSPIAWAVAWGAGVALSWALIAAIIWSLPGSGSLGIALALIIGIAVGVAINLGYAVAKDVPSIVGEGYSWMETILSQGRTTVFRRKRPTWEFAAVFAFGLTGLVGFAVADVTLGIFTFLFVLLGAFIGMIVKALVEAG